MTSKHREYRLQATLESSAAARKRINKEFLKETLDYQKGLFLRNNFKNKRPMKKSYKKLGLDPNKLSSSYEIKPLIRKKGVFLSIGGL